MAKVVCVLYDDPVDGYPKKYARDDIPKITKYPDGQTVRSARTGPDWMTPSRLLLEENSEARA
jgi:hypothetical protein